MKTYIYLIITLFVVEGLDLHLQATSHQCTRDRRKWERYHPDCELLWRQAEKKTKETKDTIKKQSQANFRENGRPYNAYPIQGMQNLRSMPLGLGLNLVPPQRSPPPPRLGGFAPKGSSPIGFSNPVGLKPPGLHNNPGFNQNPNSAEAIKQRIKHIVRDKATFINSNPNASKRIISQPLKFLIQQAGYPDSQSGLLLNQILSEEDITTLIRFLEFPAELQARVNFAVKHPVLDK